MHSDLLCFAEKQGPLFGCIEVPPLLCICLLCFVVIADYYQPSSPPTITTTTMADDLYTAAEGRA